MLMTAASPFTVVGLGELLWDAFPDGKRPGGAPANVAFQVSSLGGRGVVASRVGDDDDGRELIEFLRRQGLETFAVQVDPRLPTSRVTVDLVAGGQASYTIHQPVAWDALAVDDGWAALAPQADAICFGTLAQRSEPSRRAIHDMLARSRPDCLRVYDVNLRQNFYQRSWLEASFERASVVKLNDEEVIALAQLCGLPEDAPRFAQELISRWNVEFVCVTRGARGCLVVSAHETHDVPGRAVKVADTVGAGDAFTAGFLIARLKNWPPGLAAEFANRIGGLVAGRRGAMPDLRAEFALLMEQYE